MDDYSSPFVSSCAVIREQSRVPVKCIDYFLGLEPNFFGIYIVIEALIYVGLIHPLFWIGGAVH